MSLIIPDHLRRLLIQLVEEEASIGRLGEQERRLKAELEMRQKRRQVLVDYLLEHLPADAPERARLEAQDD